MPCLGVSDDSWVKLLAAASATCWLFPEHEGLEGLRECMTEIEMEAPDMVLYILRITEDRFNELDGEARDNVESFREQFRN